ncbi:Acg family FMN-binding oxidoreductase [Actinokineospora cianjurensis]|uniref:Nitroreductase family protein n=1 Tax=Actinokineospora cianjurensis TaxID=585224 RepID=A0A421B5A1_9PSEU|nr:nitroreductase [Actinokineospora cianjurensis]RLK59485.1 hypothetical protein CLV68_3974 [Actinokineospora cianjurensis]
MSTTVSTVHAAISAAVRAPSPFNTQPWLFAAHPDRVDLWLDRSRVMTVTDPDAHEARVGCGAALHTLRLALAVSGHRTEVHVLPDRTRPDLLATVLLDGKYRPTPHERALSEAVWRRHTNRRPFLDRPVPSPAKTALMRAATVEGAQLHLMDQPAEVGAVADLVRRADHVLSQDSAHVDEVHAWIGRQGRSDGVPVAASGRPSTPDTLIVLRELGSPAPAVPFERLPLLGVLTTVGDTHSDHLAAGQALQAVLLQACAAGLAVSPLSQPIEVPATRDALSAHVGAAAHLVLRIGYGHSGTTTPRRPVSEVVLD